jgi:hypothetical protein
LALLLVGCRSTTTAGTGRTERERDSVIGQSKVPGAHAVKRAMDVQDSARARTLQTDSASTEP